MPGWAKHGDRDGKQRPLESGERSPRGVSVTDMPTPKPQYERPHIKGVPGASSGADEDHQPGGGTWRPVTR